MTKKFLRVAILSAVAFATTGCGSAQVARDSGKTDNGRDFHAEKASLEKTNVVSPGFTLSVRHSADEEISGEFKVNLKGQLKLPYKVTIAAAGLTTDALAEKLAKAYKSYFKIKNNVSVEIVNREYLIEVRGLVQKPGVYEVKLDTTIEEVISMSGGLPGSSAESKGPKPQHIRIVSSPAMSAIGEQTVHWVRLNDYFLRYDIRNEVLWRGGEELFFQVTGDPEGARSGRSQTVQIMGEVRNPGEYPIQNGTDLLNYLAAAGGPTSTADLSEVTVIQKGSGDSSTYDLRKGTQTMQLGSGDLILVKSTQTKQGFWDRIGSTIVAIGSLGVSIVTLILTVY